MTKQSKWTQEEEEYLRLLKEEKQIRDWRTIAKELTLKFPDIKRRSKQCRQRYMNYTRFGGFSASCLDWSTDEEQIIFQKYFQHGSSWKLLSQALDKRSQNCIKNKFYSGIRKFIRRFNSVPGQNYKIKFDTIKRMLKATDPTSKDSNRHEGKFQELRQHILKFSQISTIPLERTDLRKMKQMLIDFNKEMRYLCLKKRVAFVPKTSQCRHKKSAVIRKYSLQVDQKQNKAENPHKPIVQGFDQGEDEIGVKLQDDQDAPNKVIQKGLIKEEQNNNFSTLPGGNAPIFSSIEPPYQSNFQFFPQAHFMMQYNGFFYPGFM